MSEKRIYCDHSATTPLHEEVLNEMLPFFRTNFGNASSVYKEGRESRKAVELARDRVANAIGAEPNEIYFTSSGTESDNWVLRGISTKKGKHIITSSIEHPAVLETCKDLEKKGYEVTYLPVDEDGLVSPQEVKDAIRDDTILVSIMFANNEIGTIQPIAEIGEVCKNMGVPFHTDAVQAVGNVPINVKEMNMDFLSMSAHKFYGPKGVGALYVRKGLRLANFLTGGHQERGRRASTENVPGIVGLGKAIEIATNDIGNKAEYLRKMRDRAIERIEKEIPYVKLNGHREKRLPGHVNFSFRYIEGESILLMLDLNGVAASSGSACSSGSLDPSHVLLAIGLSHEVAHGSLRLTFGRENTLEEIDYVVDKLKEIVERLRFMSPLYEGVEKEV
ncbi:MAG TPA: cysteine desulfurase NifS [Clostridia bacterium]|nr:cysteine desulfurase NifS [Clostridia bacterium]HPZ52378.1 cysteine desulfurase NifS [Clostridia bacterium]